MRQYHRHGCLVLACHSMVVWHGTLFVVEYHIISSFETYNCCCGSDRALMQQDYTLIDRSWGPISFYIMQRKDINMIAVFVSAVLVRVR